MSSAVTLESFPPDVLESMQLVIEYYKFAQCHRTMTGRYVVTSRAPNVQLSATYKLAACAWLDAAQNVKNLTQRRIDAEDEF